MPQAIHSSTTGASGRRSVCTAECIVAPSPALDAELDPIAGLDTRERVLRGVEHDHTRRMLGGEHADSFASQRADGGILEEHDDGHRRRPHVAAALAVSTGETLEQRCEVQCHKWRHSANNCLALSGPWLPAA